MKLVKITALNSTYPEGGKKYGPFAASPDAPYLEVPDSLASGLGLPLYDPEDAGRMVAPDLATVTAERDEHKAAAEQANVALEAAQKQIQELKEAAPDSSLPEGAVLLPPDALDRLIAVKGIGTSLAEHALAALKAEPEKN